MVISDGEDGRTGVCIRVSGCVDQRLAHDLGLSTGDAAGEWPNAGPSGVQRCESVLAGYVIDQAALMGVLNTLYNYGYSILSVESNPSVQIIRADEVHLPEQLE